MTHGTSPVQLTGRGSARFAGEYPAASGSDTISLNNAFICADISPKEINLSVSDSFQMSNLHTDGKTDGEKIASGIRDGAKKSISDLDEHIQKSILKKSNEQSKVQPYLVLMGPFENHAMHELFKLVSDVDADRLKNKILGANDAARISVINMASYIVVLKRAAVSEENIKKLGNKLIELIDKDALDNNSGFVAYDGKNCYGEVKKLQDEITKAFKGDIHEVISNTVVNPAIQKYIENKFNVQDLTTKQLINAGGLMSRCGAHTMGEINKVLSEGTSSFDKHALQIRIALAQGEILRNVEAAPVNSDTKPLSEPMPAAASSKAQVEDPQNGRINISIHSPISISGLGPQADAESLKITSKKTTATLNGQPFNNMTHWDQTSENVEAAPLQMRAASDISDPPHESYKSLREVSYGNNFESEQLHTEQDSTNLGGQIPSSEPGIGEIFPQLSPIGDMAYAGNTDRFFSIDVNKMIANPSVYFPGYFLDSNNKQPQGWRNSGSIPLDEKAIQTPLNAEAEPLQMRGAAWGMRGSPSESHNTWKGRSYGGGPYPPPPTEDVVYAGNTDQNLYGRDLNEDQFYKSIESLPDAQISTKAMNGRRTIIPLKTPGRNIKMDPVAGTSVSSNDEQVVNDGSELTTKITGGKKWPTVEPLLTFSSTANPHLLGKRGKFR